MDRRIDPPETRTFTSANGKFSLRVVTLDHWKTREPVAVFSQSGHELWRMTLPHSHGPREAVVTNTGNSVLLDEWVKIKSNHAVTIIPKDGKGQKVWTFEDVRSVLDVPSKTLTQAAKSGVWLGGPPKVVGNLVHVPAGGKTLIIDAAKMKLR